VGSLYPQGVSISEIIFPGLVLGRVVLPTPSLPILRLRMLCHIYGTPSFVGEQYLPPLLFAEREIAYLKGYNWTGKKEICRWFFTPPGGVFHPTQPLEQRATFIDFTLSSYVWTPFFHSYPFLGVWTHLWSSPLTLSGSSTKVWSRYYILIILHSRK